MSALSKYELVWAATYALEFKALREQYFAPYADTAKRAMIRADSAVAAMIDAEKVETPEQERPHA